MGKKRIIFISIFVIIIIFVISFLSAIPKIKEEIIKNEIKKANYCEEDLDCIDAGSKCPFGCFNYVNKNEVERISNLIESYNSNCVYGCLLCENVKCEDKKCIPICD
ncbi:MAG: hypothetical protein PHT94_00415 [Candidatus Nanoarchaeia archaeon]|nr:hypothetical protein [Candidatus Nanoarchaeia archaeon]